MSPNQLKGLLASARRGDDKDFQNTAASLARQLCSFHSTKADQALGDAINDFAKTCKGLDTVQKAIDGRFGATPTHGTEPRIGFSDLRLPRGIAETLGDILLELEHPEEFLKHQVRPAKAILLHGPSGTGKTSIAHALAKESGRVLHVALASDLESQYMGQTAKSLAEFVRMASGSRCVLLLDECDTLLHKRRTEGTTAREEGSITNTLLQQLDCLHPNVFFVATTNLLQSVDSAAMRRFDHIIEIPLPSERAIQRRADELAKKHKLDSATVAGLDLGASYATCEVAVLRAVRRQIAEKLGAARD